jgi:hypothetical protein
MYPQCFQNSNNESKRLLQYEGVDAKVAEAEGNTRSLQLTLDSSAAAVAVVVYTGTAAR